MQLNVIYLIISYNKDHIFKNTKSLQNNFIITCVDKAPNNYAIICISHYHEILNSILTSDKNFKLSTDSIIIKNKQIHAFHKLLKILQSNSNYPYLVLILKFIKIQLNFELLQLVVILIVKKQVKFS